MNRIGRLPCAGLALMAALGILLGDVFAPDPRLPAAGAMLCGVAALGLGRSWLVHAGVVFAFASIHTVNWHECPARRFASTLGERERLIEIEGVVASEPRLSASGRASFIVQVSRWSPGRSDPKICLPDRPLVRVVVDGACPASGSRIVAGGIARRIERARNPGEFDFAAHMTRRGVFTEVEVQAARHLEVIEESGRGWREFLSRCRAAGETFLGADLEDSPEVAATIKAVTLGATDDAGPELIEAFRDSGALHLFSVSGLHVGMFAWLLHTVVSLLRLPRGPAVVLAILAVGFYVLLTGASSAAVRAGVMSAVVLAGVEGRRTPSALNSLFAAALLLLAIDTNQMFHVGFQLSFSAVIGIMAAYRPLVDAARPWIGHDPFLPAALVSPIERKYRKFLLRTVELIALSVGAALGTAIVSWHHFHLLTPVSVATNLVVVPCAFVMLALGMASLITGPLGGLLPMIWNNANWVVTLAVLASVNFFAGIPGGSVRVGVRPFARDGRIAEMLLMDTRRGCVVLARTRDGAALFNSGGRRDYRNIVREVLAVQGVNKLGCVIFTQGDANHYGGGVELLEDFGVDRVVVSAVDDASKSRKEVEGAAQERGISVERKSAGDRFVLGKMLAATVLHPVSGQKRRAAKERAMAIRIEMGEWRVLLMSGGDFSAESDLIEKGADVGAHILIFGDGNEESVHHPDFVRHVKPWHIACSDAKSLPSRAVVTSNVLDLSATGALSFVLYPDRVCVEPFLQPGVWESSLR